MAHRQGTPGYEQMEAITHGLPVSGIAGASTLGLLPEEQVALKARQSRQPGEQEPDGDSTPATPPPPRHNGGVIETGSVIESPYAAAHSAAQAVGGAALRPGKPARFLHS